MNIIEMAVQINGVRINGVRINEGPLVPGGKYDMMNPDGFPNFNDQFALF